MIGECPKEIADCTTGSKGIYHEVHYLKDKWPTEDDWIRILSNVSGIGKIMKERRLGMRITRKEVTRLLGVGKDYVRKVENGKFYPRAVRLRKIMDSVGINSKYLIERL
jgi:hypothetical protein